MQLKPGSTHLFNLIIQNPDGTPAVPTEPGKFKILDKNNKVLTEGRLMRGYAEGEFETQWVIPITKPSNPYKILAQINTAENGWLSHTESFQIQEEEVPDYNYISMVTYGQDSLNLRSPKAGNFQISFYGTSDTPLVVLDSLVIEIGDNKITADMISQLHPGFYTASIRQINDTGVVTGEPSIVNFAVANMRFWTMLPRLRTYLDRYHKNPERINGYTNEMLYTWFVEGLSKVNAQPFLTSWTMASFPKEPHDVGLVGMWIRAAAYYGLRSQVLVEGELQFDYNGPNVTVTRDNMQALEAEISRLEMELDDAIKQSKKIMKANGNIGVLSHRKPGARSFGRGARIRA
ncbi:hypothetical protein [Ewingella americana]|uniref:Uncharacterized protein n=1 Tax=Ewingella americana TaxID=41202 RepID=A0A502GEI0_9GAMM|nr:hypothetical protein [Ewingella americana]TPG60141.1 hypothetical protein EAH77_16360 [Ewingella americana]